MKPDFHAPRRNRATFLAGPLALALLLSACGAGVPAPTSSAGGDVSGGQSMSIAPQSPTSGSTHAEDKANATGSEIASQPVAPVRITPEEAKTRLDAGEAIILVDVRTAEEHAEVRIPGSLLLPVDEIGQRAGEVLPDTSATLFVYCRSGRRSAIAADDLSKRGYTAVYDLGGIIDWPYETETGPTGNP